MPTSTFFRLSEEKRKRLIDVAWKEFTSNSYNNASINRIIRCAHIPRGSFYQYFADKTDLFWYLIGEIRSYFLRTLRELLEDAEGDLLAVPLRAFDRFVGEKREPEPFLTKCIQVMLLNQGLDFQRFCTIGPEPLSEELVSCIDVNGYRRKDRDFISHIFFLVVGPLAFSIMETLRAPDQWERQRTILQERVEIVRAGCLAPEGYAACARQQ